jgi:chromatin remodeling complex protein RSC6
MPGLTKPMKLSADLSAIVGKDIASRAECIKLLWAYLKKNNLIDPNDKQFFTPDQKMAKGAFTYDVRFLGR